MIPSSITRAQQSTSRATMDPRLRGRPHAASAASSSSTGFTKPLTFGSSAPAPAPNTNTNNSTAAKFITPLSYSNARTTSPASNHAAPLPSASTSYSATQYPAAAVQHLQHRPQYSAPAPALTGSAWPSSGFAPPLNFASTTAPPAPAPAASVYSAYAPAKYATPAMPGIPGMSMLPGAGAGQQPNDGIAHARKRDAASSTMYSAMPYPSTYETVEKKMKARSAAGLPPRPHAPPANKAPLPGPQVPANAVVTGTPPPLPPTPPMLTSYECDACEKSFSTLDQYRTHTSTHVKCSQCTFAASGRVVKQHEEDMHGIGGGKDVKEIPRWCKIKLDTPEALAKWIEDRKRRYPTDANIQKKKDEIAAKIARSELLPNGKRPPKPRPERPAKRPRTDDDGPAGEGGDDGAPDELGTHDGPAGADAEFAPVHKSHRICVYWRRGHCRNGDNCRFRHDPGCAPRGSPAAREAAKKAGGAAAGVGTRQRRKPLLAKLLEREMNLEHSHILQCLRFMVNNRFFVEGVTWTGQMPAIEGGDAGEEEGAVDKADEGAAVEEGTEKDGEDVSMDQKDGDGRAEDTVGADPTLMLGRVDGGGDRGVSALPPPADAGEPEDGEIEECELGPMDDVMDEVLDVTTQPVEEEGAIMVDLF
ncbi:hypothetical protein AMAG_15521 [Allomyces macrogynus ATCC 38327]|uniref:C3H1-type domain-containing protein n=1 Tax=Allomyces macrogynus (strain ATCC 38327) TaxID=578462 RepID=A0A0L0T988_ALLM3|nr:hypothetical protein AMAG_15521 [Allomyces macrogynus ATCC 38327]|eukprot:KNE71281.1 hypothetical protein AMAG_15521 [Allomyces macrogynus ATCC 38327]